MTETYTSDNLIAGDHPCVTEEVTVLSGQNLVRGSLLGKVTASEKVVLSLAASGDGSEAPYAVLAEDVDASAADAKGVAYLSGEFNEDDVTFGTGHTAASVRAGLRDLSIYLKSSV